MAGVARILVVEDSADISDLIAHYLQQAGHEVDRLSTGKAVLAHVRAHPPDVIVLDLMLPEMDGLLVCQALRADLALTRELLARNGVKPLLASEEMICIGPADALGGYLLFHAPAVSDPWKALRNQ